VDWRVGKVVVKVGSKDFSLPVANDVEDSLRVTVKTRPGVTRVSKNSFEGLPLDAENREVTLSSNAPSNLVVTPENDSAFVCDS
jgi:hypothetical protein